jgi:hypothetical protein
MTEDERLQVEMAEALFAPSEIGVSDYVCRVCAASEQDCPVLACSCGCDRPMDRQCPLCGSKMQAVRRQ